MSYLSAQDAAGNIWSNTLHSSFLTQALFELSMLELDLTAPELMSDEEVLACYEFLGSIFHSKDWSQLSTNASQLPIPGSSFDFYCVDRAYHIIARHAYSRAWEHSPKHRDWIDTFRSMTSTGGYVSIPDANDSFSLSDPAFSGALDAPTWYGVGSCWKPVNPGTLQIESMPKVDFILAACPTANTSRPRVQPFPAPAREGCAGNPA